MQGATRQPRQGLEEQWHHFTVNTTAEGSPVITHSTWYGVPRKSSPVLLAGLCLPCEQTGWIRASHWKPWQTPVPWEGLCSQTGQGMWLTLNSFFWGASGNLPFIPLSHCLQWHLWALHLIPLSFALGTEFCWSFTYFVGSEGIPHDHLPILNESTEKEKLRPSRDVAASLLPSLGKSKLCCSFPLPSLLYPFVSILTTAQWSQWCTKETLLSSTVVSTPSEVYLFLTEMTHVWLKDQFIFQFFSLPS